MRLRELLLLLLAGLPAGCPAPAGDDDDTTADDDDTAAADDDDDDDAPATIFADVSDAAGLDPTAEGAHGVAAADFDGDGWTDLFFGGADSEAAEPPHRLYLNRGDGTFEDASDAWVPGDLPTAIGTVAADLDDDGDPDLLLAATGRNVLLRNDGDGFTDATPAVFEGAGDVLTVGYAAADVDGDGALDVYEINHEFVTGGGGGDAGEFPPDRLLLGDGTGDFTDASHLLDEGRRSGAGFAAAWTDPDADGDLDLYVANDHGHLVRNQLFVNLGADGFQAWSEICGCGLEMAAMGIAVGDYDGDTHLDLYVSNEAPEALLKGNGDGVFVESAAAAGAVAHDPPEREISWAVEFLDADNDGRPDLFVGFGGKVEVATPDDRLLLNAGGTFAPAPDSGLDDLPGDTRGAAVLDFDRDGCLDLAVTNARGAARLMRNTCREESAHWLEIELEGTTSPRLPAGARVELVAGGRTQVRELSVGSTSVHSSRWPTLHFGLGDDAVADTVTIRWPSGTMTTMEGVDANAVLHVVEGE